MTLDEKTRREAARALREADLSVRPVEPPSRTHPGLDVADAYDIQLRNIAARVGEGARTVGYKVGLTSRVVQELLGVDEPDFGHLLDDMVVEDGATVDASRYCAPRAEPEICFRLARGLRGPGVTAADVLAATDAVAPALEIADSRVRDWEITLVDTVADNASAGALVHGPWTPLSEVPDLAALTAELYIDGESVARGEGKAVLGHPAEAVAWLADGLAGIGAALEPGQVVLSGSITTAPFVTAGHRVEARFDALGAVSVSFS
ncbi:fumarylacetoacetate hydrolase family protein [Nocardiopsis sp. NPDC006139]|uniref:2-keto-4-pentenoate hydratase n=1 Tax=Nocardiopsis sp. NPDC006139 TaxID=3154578 RepID=UPI0033BB5D0A